MGIKVGYTKLRPVDPKYGKFNSTVNTNTPAKGNLGSSTVATPSPDSYATPAKSSSIQAVVTQHHPMPATPQAPLQHNVYKPAAATSAPKNSSSPSFVSPAKAAPAKATPAPSRMSSYDQVMQRNKYNHG